MSSSKNARLKRRQAKRRKLHRAAARSIKKHSPQPPSIENTYPLDREFRITTDEYGARYNRVKGTVSGHDDGKIVIQTTRRKKPLVVDPTHLETV